MEDFFCRFAHTVRRAIELNHKSSEIDTARKKLDSYIAVRIDPDTKQLLEAAVDAVGMYIYIV